MSRALVRTAIAIAGLLALTAGSAPAQQRFYTPEERILIGNGGLVLAVAAGPFDVYAATESGVLVYDANRDRWKTPLPLPIEMAASRPSALAFDPAGGTLWLGTQSGDVFSIAPGFDRWDRMSGALRGRVESIVAWPRDGSVYILAGGEWLRVQPGSFLPDRVPVNGLPPEVRRQATRLPEDPWFRAASGTLGLDPRNRRWQITDVAEGRQPGEFWIGTDGGGIVRFDTRSGRQQWLRYGLPARGAGSIALVDGHVWIGSDGRDGDGGVAWTSRDLGQWGQQLREDGAPAGFVAEIVRFGGATWFAAADGLFRLDDPPAPGERGDWSRMTSADGLGSDRARSLTVFAGLLWVGTDAGVTPFDSTGRALRQPLFAGQRVSRMAARGDSLFLATQRGLHSIVATDRAAAIAAAPTPVGRSPSLRGPLADVVADDSRTFVIAGNDVVDAGGPGTPLRAAALDRIGTPYRLALADGLLWVAGRGGIARLDPATGEGQAFTVPADVHAGPVLDVLPADDHVWAATPAGAVRLRWQ